MNFGLTERQLEVLGFVQNVIRETGVAPSYDEIAAVFETPKSNAYRIVTELVERGYVIRMPGKGRSLQVRVTCCPSCGHMLEPLQVTADATYRVIGEADTELSTEPVGKKVAI